MPHSFCHSCGMPLNFQDAASPCELYCIYCTDEKGNLKPWKEKQEGLAAYLMTWQPDITHEIALQRAERYLTAMPAWAFKTEGE